MLKQGDFAQFGVYAIFAGMGSGKSYWAETVLPTWYDNIYYVTSREVKAAQIVEGDNPFTKKIKTNFVTGNFSNMTNLLRKYGIKYFERFDAIVIDEVHALFTDSTFSDDCFQILRLIDYIRKNEHIHIRLIFLTATINRFKAKFKRENITIIDLTQSCTNNLPRNIIIESREGVVQEMVRISGTGLISALMVNHAEDIMRYYIPKLKTYGIQESQILPIMSDKRAGDFKILEQYESQYQYISKNNKIPPEILIVLATSRFREGINIRNQNIGFVGNESSDSVALQQFFGRYRLYDSKYYIIRDLTGNHIENITKDDYEISEQICQIINSKFSLISQESEKEEFIKKNNHGDPSKLITYSIVDNIFMINNFKYEQIQQAIYENKAYNNDIVSYIMGLYPDAEIVSLDCASDTLHNMFKLFSENQTKIYYDENPAFWALLYDVCKLKPNSHNFINTLNKLCFNYSDINNLNFTFVAEKKSSRKSSKSKRRNYIIIKIMEKY